ncbi:allatostatin [Battus philenor]|uniref:allatostatin n=1 Tax=Battus philenor TaxID=42288 RepID=UPI0035D02F03
MNTFSTYNKMLIILASLAFFFSSVTTLQLEQEGGPSENTLISRMESPDEPDMSTAWDQITAAALRKLIAQLDTEDRLGRVGRSWPQSEPRGWGLRAIDGRLARQWRTDKRQVRFRQCYFNPISCFRK